MRNGFILRPALVATAALAVGCAAPEADQWADTIYVNGDIVTVNDAQPSAGAVAVKDGIIVAVGTEAEVLRLRGESTVLADLDGKTLVPGFVDGHAHLSGFGAQAVGANLLASPDGSVDTIDDLVRALQVFAAGPDVGRTGWVFGMGYDDAVLAEGRHPTRDDLDQVSEEKAVFVIHQSGHLYAANSALLALAGITAQTEDPPGGVIRRRAGSREPDGVLEESALGPILGLPIHSLGRQEDGKGHVAAGGFGLVAVDPLHAAKAAIFGDSFHRLPHQ